MFSKCLSARHPIDTPFDQGHRVSSAVTQNLCADNIGNRNPTDDRGDSVPDPTLPLGRNERCGQSYNKE